MASPLESPETATIAQLVALAKEMGAGTMKMSGRDGQDRPVFIVLIAVDEEACRLEPEIERLTADEPEKAPKKKGERRG